MNNTNTSQKKKVITTVIYSAIVGLIVLACAIIIAVTTSKTRVNNNAEVGGGEGGEIQVSSPTYFVPVQNATVQKDYSATEHQYNGSMKHWEIHRAIDFVVSDILDVFAFTDGTVSDVRTNNLEGTVVEIAHDNGLVSVYKSLASANVKVGDKVAAGSIIGKVGDTMGYELQSGAHLHFELWQNGEKIDPNAYLSLSEK